jgi:hypothetical protein
MVNRRWKLGRTEHELVSEQLSAYMDRQLATPARAQVERHLATCAECREELRSMQWTRQLLQQAPVARVPRSFVIREADVARARPATRRGSVLALRWASSMVALLLVLVFAGDLLTSGLLTGARLASAPEPYGEVVEEQAVEAESVAVTQEAMPTVAAGEALKVAVAPSPTVEPAAKMAVQEKKEGDEAPGMGAVQTATPAPPGLAAPSATLPSEPTPTPAAESLAAEDSTNLTRGAEPTAEAEQVTAAAVEPTSAEAAMEQATLMAAEPTSAEVSGPGVLREREEDQRSRIGSWLNGWRVAEIGLGAALLVLLIAAIWMRLRR